MDRSSDNTEGVETTWVLGLTELCPVIPTLQRLLAIASCSAFVTGPIPFHELVLHLLHTVHKTKDTEALVSDLQMPEIYSEVVCREVRAVVAVHRDRVDVVGVGIGKYPPGHGLDRNVILDFPRDSQLGDCPLIPHQPFVCDCVHVVVPATSLRDLPQLDGLVYEEGEEMEVFNTGISTSQLLYMYHTAKM